MPIGWVRGRRRCAAWAAPNAIPAAPPPAADYVTSAVEELGSVEGLRAQPRAGAVLARVLATAIAFDIGKAYRAAIVNDFSFYRRVLGKVESWPDLPCVRRSHRRPPCSSPPRPPLLQFAAQAVGLSQHVPGRANTHDVGRARGVGQGRQQRAAPLPPTRRLWRPAASRPAHAPGARMQATLPILTELAHASCAMIMRRVVEPAGEEGVMCARAMVASMWLVDHLAPAGVFARGSAVRVRLCIKQLRVAGDSAKPLRRFLLHSSRTAQDRTTPGAIVRELRQ